MNYKIIIAMAKQSGIVKLEGTIGDISFYKTQDGMLARAKGGVSSDRIQSDASFQRTRENMEEFGKAGAAGKLLRTAIRQLLQNCSDNRMVSRLTKEMMKVVKADLTSIRGQRNVLDGELELLEGFDFNINAKLSSTIFFAYLANIDRGTGALTLSIPAFVSAETIVFPEGATHFRLISAGAAINFEDESFEVVVSQGAVMTISQVEEPAFVLTNQLTANSPNPLFLALGIEFYQQVNGVNYQLKNGNNNALSLVRVLGL